MKTLTLKRIIENKDGMFGVLIDWDVPFALTLERQWLNNEPMLSCIPAGDYICKRVISPKFGDVFKIIGVEGRNNILFHKGNVIDHTEGCILIGEEFGSLDGKTAVLNSGKGFGEFMEKLKGLDEFKIIIEKRR